MKDVKKLSFGGFIPAPKPKTPKTPKVQKVQRVQTVAVVTPTVTPVPTPAPKRDPLGGVVDNVPYSALKTPDENGNLFTATLKSGTVVRARSERGIKTEIKKAMNRKAKK